MRKHHEHDGELYKRIGRVQVADHGSAAPKQDLGRGNLAFQAMPTWTVSVDIKLVADAGLLE